MKLSYFYSPHPLSQWSIARKCSDPVFPRALAPGHVVAYPPCHLQAQQRMERRTESEPPTTVYFNDGSPSLIQSPHIQSCHSLPGDGGLVQTRLPAGSSCAQRPPSDPWECLGAATEVQADALGGNSLWKPTDRPQAVVTSTVVTSAGLTDVWVSEMQLLWH